jgi:hypothetical protein
MPSWVRTGPVARHEPVASRRARWGSLHRMPAAPRADRSAVVTPSLVADETEDNDRLVRALEAAGVEIDHLRVALGRRLVIGQAQGMLMERLGIDAGQAFDHLKRMSSQRNQKVYVIAEDIVRTRVLPGL